MNANAMAAIDSAILEEAADWLLRLQSGDLDVAGRAALERWRERSPQHRLAWQRAEAVLATFDRVPAELRENTLPRLGRSDRRRALRTLVSLLAATPAVWLAWRQLPLSEWRADFRTATGARRSVLLADGTQLLLNTATAVDVAFDAAERRLIVRAGEILVTTGHDPQYRAAPFVVQTAQGSARALGTRFTVRQRERSTQVAVFDGAVELRPSHGAGAVLRAGERSEFDDTVTAPAQAVDELALLWQQGMLVARNMRLSDLLAELDRYRSGVLRCHPDIAGLRVSGAFPLDDIEASLRLLQKTLPVRISATTRYWITIEAA